METLRPSKIGQDRDRFSALPDELLLGIIERLSLRDAVRVGAISTRWQHLPHQLSRVDLNADDFQGTTPIEAMDSFTGAVCSLLSACPPAESQCDCKSRRAVKILSLRFYPSAAHLGSIGRAVEETVSRGETNRFEFELILHSSDKTAPRQAGWGQQFMSFSHAFRWLTGLSLTSLEFGDSDLPTLLSTCVKLKRLSLTSCRLVGRFCAQIRRTELCNYEARVQPLWVHADPSRLCSQSSRACRVILGPISAPPCASATYLSFNFMCVCVKVNRDWHPCLTTSEDSAEKTNVMWEPSKDLKHPKLKLLIMAGFEEEEKVINYIRLVMERATGLKTIELQSHTCDACDSIDRKRYQADQASMRQIKERLKIGPSSSVEIIMGWPMDVVNE